MKKRQEWVREALAIFAVLAVCAVRAADGVWIGTADGNWSNTANWKDGVYASGAGATAYFTNGAAVTVTQDLGSLTIGNLYVANASITLTNNAITLSNSGSPAITVDGNSVTANVSLSLSPATASTFIKNGSGTFMLNKYLSNLTGMTLNGGLTYLGFVGNSDGLNVGTGTINVKKGAVLKFGSNNQISNYTVINVETGGVFDVNGMTDNIGAITGAGVVTNVSGAVLNFRLNGLTRVFSGLCLYNATFNFQEPGGVYATGSSNAFESVWFNLYNPGQLGFAPGASRYLLGGLSVTNLQTVALVDTDGNPVTLALGGRNADMQLGVIFSGTGGFEKTGTGTLTFTNAQSFTGPATVSGGTLRLGDGVRDGSLPAAASITVQSGKTLAFNTVSNQTVAASIYGNGAVTKAQNSAVALNAFSMSTGTVTVSAGTLAINGGNYIGGSFVENAGAQLVFSGGNGTGATLAVGSVLASPIRITGGTHHFATALGLNGFRIEQTGGASQFIGAHGDTNTNLIFATVSGGSLRVANIGDYPQGLGLLVCSNATVRISDFGNAGQRLASDGKSHEIIVTNNASLMADSLRLISPGNTASTGTLSLAGGTFTVANIINVVDTSTNSYIIVNFNGGLLRVTNSMTIASTPYSTFRVFEGGARIDSGTLQNQINQPLVSALSGTTDGGLTKYGASVLVLATNASYTGQTTAKAGTLRTLSGVGEPFGGGSLFVNGGTLQAYPAGSGLTVALAAADGAVGGTVAYGPGPSTLGLSKGSDTSVALTLGNSGAAAASVLVRTNGGVLAVSPANGTAASNLGANEKVLVNGGVATVNGMVSPVVAGIGSDTPKSVDFLNYDAANGLVLPTYTTGLAGGAASIANVASSTSFDSAQVYALRVHNGATLTANSGATLTVGDGVNPAGVILNNASSSRAVVTNGTLAFGASEGVVWFNQSSSAGGARISSTITGSGGLTLVGGGPSESLTLDAPSGNAYSGGTRIMAGRVDVVHSRGFGDGDVYLYGNEGWGGQFLFNFAATVTNAFHLAGVGVQEWPYFGAIRFNTDAALSGPVDLMDDARIGANSLKTGTLSGSIGGVGGLEISGTDTNYIWGQIVLKGVNTYVGATRINNGALQLASGGTFGQGPVVNNAVLLFNSDADQTVTNALSGTGRIVKRGAGRLSLTGTNACTGGFQIDGGAVSVGLGLAASATTLGVNGSLDLGSSSLGIGHLAGTGTVSATSGAVTLTVGSDNSDSQYRGTIANGSGTVALTKVGSGTLTLGGQNTYGGATVVGAGTLKLESAPSLLTNGLSYQMDASRGVGVTLSGSNVAVWADVSGSGVAFTQTLAHLQPVFVTNALNGLGAVRFNGAVTNRMVAAKAVNAQTVFIVDAMTGYMNLAGLWGRAANDTGIRAFSSTSWQLGGDANDFTYGGEMYINGLSGSSFAANTQHVLSAVSPIQRQGWSTAIGDYWGAAGYQRSFTGLIGEILVYGSMLNASDRQTIEAYLAYKWQGVGSGVATNVLPAGTALSVSNNAVFDLNGVSQTVASLAGAGAVTNSSGTGATLTIGGDNSSALFSGAISGSNAVAKTGSGTFTLSGANTYLGSTLVGGGTLTLSGGANRLPTGTTVEVASGATLNLNGQSQTLYGIAGSGSVSGGSLLTVTGLVSPGGDGVVGTLTIFGTPSLSGTLLIDTRKNGTCDLLDVEGSLDLSSLSLQIADAAQMGGYTLTIATCTGDLTGSFASANLSRAWTVRYDRTSGAGKVELVHKLGTQVLVQ